MNTNWQETWKENVEKTVEQLTKNSPFTDMGQNAKTFFTSALQKLDVVTREEFDVQQEVLARTREKLEQLEARLAKLEALVLPPQAVAEAAPVEAEAEQAAQGHS